jgi:hypothetical protein
MKINYLKLAEKLILENIELIKHKWYETSMVLRITKVHVNLPHASSMDYENRMKLAAEYN